LSNRINEVEGFYGAHLVSAVACHLVPLWGRGVPDSVSMIPEHTLRHVSRGVMTIRAWASRYSGGLEILPQTQTVRVNRT
jgi:hypothetical protein